MYLAVDGVILRDKPQRKEDQKGGRLRLGTERDIGWLKSVLHSQTEIK